MATVLIPQEQRKLIVQELSRINMTDPAVREQLKQSFGEQAFEHALKTAQAKALAAAVDPNLQKDKRLPKALCSGGDISVLAGVNVTYEADLLARIRRSKQATSSKLPLLIKPDEVSLLAPDGQIGHAVGSVVSRAVLAGISRLLKDASAFNKLIRKKHMRGDSEEKTVSVFNHPNLEEERNLRRWGLKALLAAVSQSKGPLADLWQRRVLDRIQSAVLQS